MEQPPRIRNGAASELSAGPTNKAICRLREYSVWCHYRNLEQVFLIPLCMKYLRGSDAADPPEE